MAQSLELLVSFDVGCSVKVHREGRGFDFHCPHYMNEDNKIIFVYIAGKNHGRVDIATEQLNEVMGVLYGKAEEA